MAYNPALLRAIQNASARTGVPVNVLVATTLAESDGRVNATGDGGHSGGAWMENDWGRGAGIPMAQRFNIVASTNRAANEFQRFMQKGGYGGNLGQLAANAQRPADRAGYALKINGLLGGAVQAILGGSGGAITPVGQSAQALPANTGGFSGIDVLRNAQAGRLGNESLTAAVRRTLAAQYVGMSGRPFEDVPQAPTPAAVGGGTLLGQARDRPGASTQPGILAFVRQIAGAYGRPITLGTGTAHNRLTTSGNVSDHWAGNAIDLPATGNQLLQMGQSALIAAGMNPAQARRQKGGVFNITDRAGVRHQILFNTNVGGNHFDHLHVSG